jgi:hypothetical protein
MTTDLAQQVEAKKLGLELKMLEGKEKMLDSAQKMRETAWGEVVPRTDYPWQDASGFSNQGSAHRRSVTTVDDRTEGKFYPVYRDEYDLRRMRNKHRAIFHFVSVASGLVESLIDYTVGEGFTIEVVPKSGYQEDQASIKLAKTMQSVTDELLDSIGFHGDRDRDLVQVPVSDGELYWALYADKYKQRDGFPKLRNVEPDEVTEPNDPYPVERWLGTLDKYESFWKFGVHTRFCKELKKEDVEGPLGYHLAYDDGGIDWDYIPSDNMIHIKRNVGRRAKRGVSDFLATEMTLEKAHKLGARTADGALAQASIAYIRKWEASQTDVQAMVDSSFGFNVKAPKDNSTEERRAVSLDKTKIVDVPAGATYEAGPMGQLRSPVFVEVAQYLLRLSAVRWSMPEFMISGDASNANFASTLVTESPFVKARERDQRQAIKAIKELVWKSLKIMWNAGYFRRYANDWAVLVRLVDINVTAPEVATRDHAAMATTNEILVRNKIKSKRTWAEEEGLDYEAEQANMEDEPSTEGDENFLSNDSANAASGQPSIASDEANDVPAQGGEETSTSNDGLNGAQIKAAVEMLQAVSAGTMAGEAALALLVQLGMDEVEANKSVVAAKAIQVTAAERQETIESIQVTEDTIFEYLKENRDSFVDPTAKVKMILDTDTGKSYFSIGSE